MQRDAQTILSIEYLKSLLAPLMALPLDHKNYLCGRNPEVNREAQLMQVCEGTTKNPVSSRSRVFMCRSPSSKPTITSR